MAASTGLSIDEILNYVPLTEPVKTVQPDLPRVLPDEFYNTTKDVLGDRFRRILFTANRQPSVVAPYGSPPRQVQKTAIGSQEVVMLHSIEEISAGPEVLKLFHDYDGYGVQLNAIDELNRQAEDFGTRQANLELAAIHSAWANGKIWFDANGNILPTSAGADIEYDLRVPSGNRFAFAASWADPAQDIPTMVNNFMTTGIKGKGRKPKYAIYGKGVAGYLARNTAFQAYLARNNTFRDRYVMSGQIAEGVLDLVWIPAQNAHFVDSTNTAQEQFPADQITFAPDLKGIYEVKRGSFPVPKEFGSLKQGANFGDIIKEIMDNPVYGRFRYAYGQAHPIPKINMVQGNTFAPDFLVPDDVYFGDTTP
jgi:hypothetical protein